MIVDTRALNKIVRIVVLINSLLANRDSMETEGQDMDAALISSNTTTNRLQGVQ